MTGVNIYLIVILIFTLSLAPDIVKLYRLIKRSKTDLKLYKHLTRIHFIGLILSCALLLISISFEVNIFNYSKPVEYANHRNITLQDFKGIKLPSQNLQGMSEFAYIKTSVELKSFRKENIEVETYFHPSRSYVYNDKLEDVDLLKHEIYHLHLSEVFARSLREQILDNSVSKSSSEVKKLLREILKQERKMQSKYDFDSNHGYLLGKQLAWEKRIDSLLVDLNKFSNRRIQY